MKLFLASALSNMKEELLKKVWSLQDKKIAYIINPADQDVTNEPEGENIRWLKNDRDMLESCGAVLTKVDLRVTQHSELQEMLEKLDGIYVSGGDTFYFSELAKKSGYDKVLHRVLSEGGKVYMSTSAGSCIMGTNKIKHNKDIKPWREEYTLFDAFNYVPSMILPHRWSKDFKNDYEYVLEFIYKEKQSIITLTDEQALWVTLEWIEIVKNT